MTYSQIEATLRLFKSYVPDFNETWTDEQQRNEFLASAVRKGVLFTDLERIIPGPVYDYALELYGKKPEEWNATFHKSIGTVLDTPIEVLVVQQIIHYITTYGFEELGIYDKDTVYFPKEKLEIPELEGTVPLVVINSMTEEVLKERLMKLLTSGIALSKQTIDDIMELSDYIDLDMVDDVKNREVKIALYEKYHIVPGNNLDFLRYLINKLTGETLLIKNNGMIQKIKLADNKVVYSELKGYLTLSGYYEDNRFKKVSRYNTPKTTGYEVMAQIFLRYKDLFLAMKRQDSDRYSKQINKMINKLSKLSKIYHKPLKPNVLDQLTQIKTPEEYLAKKNDILKALDEVTTFREIRILNSLKFRQFSEKDDIVYKIRNGKAFVNKMSNPKKDGKVFKDMYIMIANHLSNRLKPKVDGKTIYVPDNFHYVAPTTEKQFNGNIPEGSYIEIPRTKNMVVGVHWNNLPRKYKGKEIDDKRVDLDLHMQNKDHQFGWNTGYRSGSGSVAYSGDVTDAAGENGATEVMYIGNKVEDSAFLLTLNKFTRNKAEVPFEFIIGAIEDDEVHRNYVVNPNEIVLKIDNKFEYDGDKYENEKTLGLVMVTKDTIRFYFNDFSLGDSNVTGQTSITQGAYSYLTQYGLYQIQLDKLLVSAGAKILEQPSKTVTKYFERLENDHIEEINKDRAEELRASGNGHLVLENQEEITVDVDLSLNAISKDTIIDLLTEE